MTTRARGADSHARGADSHVAPRTRAEWLASAPFTLCLSGGFFGFFTHTGLLAALEEHDLAPARVVGCSAGALAGAAWASGLPAADLRGELERVQRHEFWDPGLPFGGLLRGKKFVRKLEAVLAPTGVRGIEETKIPTSVVTHDVLRHRTLPLTSGPLALAVRASCTVPLLFRPVRWGSKLLVDGGVSDRSGLSDVAPGERVLYHHLHDTSAGARHPKTVPGEDNPDCLTLATWGQPRVGPFRLQHGPPALQRSQEAALRWLAETVNDGGSR